MLWWGYLHIEGTIQVKPFFDALDIVEAYQSPFVKEVFTEFEAKDREDAIRIVKEKIDGNN